MRGVAMISSYDPGLVALSVMIAIFASYAALDLAGRTRAARGAARWIWLSGGASAMGLGIWAMHYIGMLAFQLPVPVLYDVPTVIVSLLAAIAASAVALFVVSRNRLTVPSVAAGSFAMGSGIAAHALHRHGRHAPARDAPLRQPARGVVGSLAIVISLVALRLTFLLRDEVRMGNWRKLGSAVPDGRRHRGHALYRHGGCELHARAVDGGHLAGSRHLRRWRAGIGSVTLMVLAFAILTSMIDRRFSTQTLELASSETRYRLLFERSLAGIYQSTDRWPRPGRQ